MKNQIDDTVAAWETRQLGADENFVQVISAEQEATEQEAIDAAFSLKPISIRMEVEVLDSIKAIAKHRGIGYQPLIRQVLHRWVDCELKQIALESMDKAEEKEIKVGCTSVHQSLQKAA